MTDQEFTKRLLDAQPTLLAYARQLTRHKERAEDALQDANLRAWERRIQYVQDVSFVGWCKTILRNEYLKKVVVEARMPMNSNNEFLSVDYTGHDSNSQAASKHYAMIAKYASIDPGQEDYWLENRILETISELPPHTALLIIKKLEGMTYEQIAKPLGIKANNAKQRYFNDIKLLRERLIQKGLIDEREQ